MKTLIIYAHPDTKGHNQLVLDEVKKKTEADVIDLYKIKYDPVMKEEELYTAGNYKVSKQNKAFQEKIKKADKLVIIYPVWWNSVPAILKGFFDRVLTPRFAYEFKNRMPVKLLKGKKAAVIVTTGGPRIVSLLLFKDRSEKVVANDTLSWCGIKSKYFVVDNCFDFNEKQQKKVKKVVDKALRWLG